MEIVWHKHHIIPKHAGGTDEKSNLIKVNIPLHAFLHKLLWEENGMIEDKVAWLTLSGQISKAEATLMIQKRPKSDEARKKMSETRKGQPGFFKGRKHTEETKEKMRQKKLGCQAWNKGLTKYNSKGMQIISEKMTGKKKPPLSEETKKKMSQVRLGKTPWNKGKTGIYSDEILERMKNAQRKRREKQRGQKNI